MPLVQLPISGINASPYRTDIHRGDPSVPTDGRTTVPPWSEYWSSTMSPTCCCSAGSTWSTPATRCWKRQDGEHGIADAVAERPDAIVLDLMLPLIDGYEVLGPSEGRADPPDPGPGAEAKAQREDRASVSGDGCRRVHDQAVLAGGAVRGAATVDGDGLGARTAGRTDALGSAGRVAVVALAAAGLARRGSHVIDPDDDDRPRVSGDSHSPFPGASPPRRPELRVGHVLGVGPVLRGIRPRRGSTRWSSEPGFGSASAGSCAAT